MKQIKVFKNPEEVSLANEFLAKNPPESVATVSKGDMSLIVINYDDQTYPPAYMAEELKGLILSNVKERMTSEISRDVMGVDLVLYEDKLKLAEEELTRLQAETAPTELKKKEAYDWEKLQGEKVLVQKQIVEDLKNSIINIKNGIEKLTDSIQRNLVKKELLEKKVAELNLE